MNSLPENRPDAPISCIEAIYERRMTELKASRSSSQRHRSIALLSLMISTPLLFLSVRAQGSGEARA
jgi:hypothetical protein